MATDKMEDPLLLDRKGEDTSSLPGDSISNPDAAPSIQQPEPDAATVHVIHLNASQQKIASGAVGLFGLILAIIMMAMLPNSYGDVVAGYCLGLHLGLYLMACAAFSFLGSKSVGQVRFAAVDTSYTCRYNVPLFAVLVDCVFGLSLLICSCTLGPYWWWAASNIISLIVSILLILKGLFGVLCLLNFNLKNLKLDEGMLASGIDGTRARLVELAKLFQDSCTWIADEETAVATIKERKYMYVMNLGLVLVLSVIPVVTELFLIRNWSNWDSYNNNAKATHIQSWIWGPMGDFASSMRYVACFSCLGSVAVTSILFGGVLRPGRATNFLVAFIAFGYGVYFALLSTYSLESLLMLKATDKSDHYNNDFWNITFRMMHLMPIPVITTILLPFGISVLLANFRLELSERGLCVRSLQGIFFVLSAFASYASLLMTTLNAELNVQSHTPDSGRPEWWVIDAYTLYLAAQGSAAIVLASAANLFLLTGKRRIPEPLAWLLSLILCGLAVFSAFTFSADSNYGDRSVDVLRELSVPTLAVNIGVEVLCLVVGIYGIFKYAHSVLSCVVFPFRALALVICHNGAQSSSSANSTTGDETPASSLPREAEEEERSTIEYQSE